MNVYILLIAGVFLIAGCLNKNNFPPEPIIKFKDLTKVTAGFIDSSAYLTITFTDGDGDIGLTENDTLAPYDSCSLYQFNIFLRYLKKVNGVYQPIYFPKGPPYPLCTGNVWAVLDSFYTGILPPITPEGRNKTLEGEIEYHLQLADGGFQFNNDTLKFEIFIYDRALHQSNVIVTPEIIVKTF